MKGRLSFGLAVILVLFTINAFGAEIIDIYFLPYQNAHLPIIELYDNAEKYIHLAIYSLTKDEFSEALIRAHRREVEVKVLIDKQQAGIQIRR